MYVNNQKPCLANSMPTYRAGMCDYEVKWFYGDFRLFSIFYGIFFVRQRCHLVTNLNNACIKGTNCLFVKGGMFWTNHGKWLQCRVSFKLTN